jgi:hypothetical protein
VALAFRQGVTANNTTGTATTGAFASSPTVGQLIVLSIADDSGDTVTVGSVTDSASNTWHRIWAVGSTASLQQWYCIPTATTASFTITAHWDTTATGRVTVVAQEFSGFTGTPTVDIVGTPQGATNTAPTSLAYTPAQANEIIIGSANHASTTSAFSLGSGYSNLTTVNAANAAVAQESKVITSIASQQAVFAIAASRAWVCNIISFYDATSSPQTISPSFISRSATVYAPTAKGSNTLTPPFVSRSATIYTPTAKGSNTLSPSLVSHAPSIYAPTITPGAVTLLPGSVSRSPSVYAPTVNLTYPSIATLSDNFNDNSTNLTLWPNSYTSTAGYAETGGQLVITLANGTTGYAGYVSGNYDLSGSSAFVQVRQVANTSTLADTLLELDIDGNNSMSWLEEGGTLYARYVVGGSGNNAGSLTYSSTSHKWWRIREASGTIYWDTSADGINWTNQFSVANPIAVTALQVNLVAGTWEAESSPGSAIFDNFNVSAQAVTPALVSRSPSVYAPTMTATRTITPSLVSRSASVYAPVVKGANTLTPSFISRSPATYAPTVKSSYTILPSALTRTPTVYSPTVKGLYTLLPGFVSHPAAIYAPTMGLGAVTIMPSLVSRSASVYAPSLHATVTMLPGFISRLPSVFSPTVTPGGVTIEPSLVTSSPAVYSPTLAAAYDIPVPFIGHSPDVYSPGVTSVYIILPSLVSRTSHVYVPSTSTAVTLSPDFLSRSPTVYTAFASAGGVVIAPDPVISSPTVYVPIVSPGGVTITPGFLEHTATVYQPSLSTRYAIVPSFITRSAVVYLPSVKGEVTALPGFVSRTAAAYVPAVTTQFTIFPKTISRTPAVYAPTTSGRYTLYPAFVAHESQMYAPVVEENTVISPDAATRVAAVYAPNVFILLAVHRGIPIVLKANSDPTVAHPGNEAAVLTPANGSTSIGSRGAIVLGAINSRQVLG